MSKFAEIFENSSKIQADSQRHLSDSLGNLSQALVQSLSADVSKSNVELSTRYPLVVDSLYSWCAVVWTKPDISRRVAAVLQDNGFDDHESISTLTAQEIDKFPGLNMAERKVLCYAASKLNKL
jgi:hypothetical protein